MTLMFWKFIGITVDFFLKLFVLPLLLGLGSFKFISDVIPIRSG